MKKIDTRFERWMVIFCCILYVYVYRDILIVPFSGVVWLLSLGPRYWQKKYAFFWNSAYFILYAYSLFVLLLPVETYILVYLSIPYRNVLLIVLTSVYGFFWYLRWYLVQYGVNPDRFTNLMFVKFMLKYVLFYALCVFISANNIPLILEFITEFEEVLFAFIEWLVKSIIKGI